VLFDYPEDELLGMNASDIGFESCPITADPVEISGIRKLGSRVPLRVSFSNVFLDGEEQTIAVFEDLTVRKRDDAKMRELVNLQGAILEHSAYGIITTTPSGMITLFNPACEKMVGYSAKEVVGFNTPIMFHAKYPDGSLLSEKSQDHFDGVMRDVGKGGSKTQEFVFRRKDGSLFVASRTISALFDENGVVTGFVAIIVDVTELKEHQKRLAHMAHYDALTNLPNRILFDQRLEHGMAIARRNRSSLALLFMDLDKFKPINDTHGHAIGDLVIKEVAVRITSCLRESESVGRVGGDEFVVLLTQLQKSEDAEFVAEKIRFALDQPMQIEGLTLHVSTCIGVALFDSESKGITKAKLSEKADAAMYVAKSLGGNRVVVSGQEG
jgi:diguanylate cyclase (GGDEF)-like protein/PAS domain S-box-containing protein